MTKTKQLIEFTQYLKDNCNCSKRVKVGYFDEIISRLKEFEKLKRIMTDDNIDEDQVEGVPRLIKSRRRR